MTMRIVGIRAALMVAVTATTILAGCSFAASGPGGETTCAEFLALGLSTEDRLAGKRSEEQDDIIKRALADRGLDAGYAGNVNVAHMQIQEFCGMKGYPEPMNSERPIEDAIN
jgi:hypothetical protein